MMTIPPIDWSLLRRLRKERGLNQQQVCDRVVARGGRLVQHQLSGIERGERPGTTHTTVAAILDALGVSWEDYGRWTP
jgi:transcriptional regulator with XRE-family HTH domain